jgi:hypothetical protein
MTRCKLYKNYPRYSVIQMWEQITRIEISLSCRPHFSSMKTLVVKISLHMYTNEYPELQT